ncbi:MAG: sugar phosphate isomerase/epimerase [Clostridiales bacterium]|nr:sugar phosphate isomerase/epimerase [Clostridiales bacterium]
MKYSLMSFMVDEELKHTKPNFILTSILRSCGVNEIPSDVEKVYEMLNSFGIPMKNGSASFEDLVRFTKEQGFSGLDMMYFQMELPGSEMREILERYQVVLSAVNIIIPFSEADCPEALEGMFQAACKAIDHAAEAGAKNILFMPAGYVRTEGVTRENTYQNIVEGLRKVLKYGKEKDLCIGTETLECSAVPYCSCAEMQRVFDAVPGLRYIHDTGNPLVANEDPIAMYEMLRDKVMSVHFKDLGYGEAGPNTYRCMDGKIMKSVPFGSGEVDFREHLRRLKKDGFDGYITLEGGIPAKDKWEEAIAAMKYFQEMEKSL